MRLANVIGLLILMTILASGCLGGDNYSKIYYSTQMTGVIYTGEDCTVNCSDYLDSFGDGREQWDQPYTLDEWNESINLNFTQLIVEAVPGGYSRIDVLMDDKFEDGLNEYYLQYKADIIYPNERINILYKAWVVRK